MKFLFFRYIPVLLLSFLSVHGLGAGSQEVPSGDGKRDGGVLIGKGEEGREPVSPASIELDADGNIYLTDSHSARLAKFSPDGTLLWEIDGREWGGDGFLSPSHIGVSSGLHLYLLDTGRREIFQVNRSGEILGVVAEGSFRDPRALVLTDTGKLVVFDAAAAEVSVLAPSGSVLWSFRPEGFRSRSNIGMVVSHEEELCFFTRGSKTLRMYHFMGGLKKVWKPALPDGRELKVSSVDFDGEGRAFVLDSDIPGLFVFDRLGNLLLDLTGSLARLEYRGPGEVRERGGVVYIADVRGGKVLKLEIPHGAF